MRRFCPECQQHRTVEDNGERERSLHYALLCLSCGAQWEPNQQTNPQSLPVISDETLRAWRSAGVRLKSRRVPGGYVIELR